jgi:D-ornithine 4,5-aminomutase subunit beta
LGAEVRELKERSILLMEEMLSSGGYFAAVEHGFFIDSGYYPERNGDGIPRNMDDGVGLGTVFLRDDDYFAPVSVHYGNNRIPDGYANASDVIGGDTFEDPSKIVWVDELDEEDNVHVRLHEMAACSDQSVIRPEVEWQADGIVVVTLFLPTDERTAEYAAIHCGEKMGLEDISVIHRQVLHPSEGTLVELKGRLNIDIDIRNLVIPEKETLLGEAEIRADLMGKPMLVVAATVGEDEHSVGLKETLDIKHGGIEKFGIKYLYLGTSCSIQKLVDAAVETHAQAILCSTIITHDDIHIKNMRKLHELCVEKGIRDSMILVGGGTQVNHEIAREAGLDAGFGRGSQGIDVASFLVKKRKELQHEG